MPSGLTALLDALEQDLLAAPADEVRDTQRETGRARQSACYEVRSLLNEAVAASKEGTTETVSYRINIWNGIPRH